MIQSNWEQLENLNAIIYYDYYKLIIFNLFNW